MASKKNVLSVTRECHRMRKCVRTVENRSHRRLQVSRRISTTTICRSSVTAPSDHRGNGSVEDTEDDSSDGDDVVDGEIEGDIDSTDGDSNGDGTENGDDSGKTTLSLNDGPLE